jgi:hypothetical protein
MIALKPAVGCVAESLARLSSVTLRRPMPRVQPRGAHAAELRARNSRRDGVRHLQIVARELDAKLLATMTEDDRREMTRERRADLHKRGLQ